MALALAYGAPDAALIADTDSAALLKGRLVDVSA